MAIPAMAGQRKKSKTQITVTVDLEMLRAIAVSAARARLDRSRWITDAIRAKLDAEPARP